MVPLYQFFIISEDECKTLSTRLRTYTQELVGKQNHPWSEGYFMNLSTVDNQLIIEKQNYSKLRDDSRNQSLNTYEWFEKSTQSSAELTGRKGTQGAKVLIKGQSGIGKTTAAKKIAWDWSIGKDYLQRFSILLFASIDWLKVDDAIENIIIRENSVLQKQNRKRGELSYILENFGSQCLLILDGIDENACDINKDVLEIMKSKKYPRCSYIFTSRSELATEIEEFFPTVVIVKGLSKQYAEDLALEILMDDKQVDSILELNLNDDEVDKVPAGQPLYKVPLLLLFVCVLENKFNFPVKLGEIYYNALKYAYSRNKRFKGQMSGDLRDSEKENDDFANFLRPVTKLAFRILRDGNFQVNRKELFETVGDSGLVTGHGDSIPRLPIGAQTYIAFPHITVLEFLGAFYFKKLKRLKEKEKEEWYEATKKQFSRSESKALFKGPKLLEKSTFFRYCFDWA